MLNLHSILPSILPKRVYKFMEPKRLKQLQQSKNFFINHLNNYKEAELGSEIGDDCEGRLTTNFDIGRYVFNNGTSENPAFEKAFHSMQNRIKIDEGCTDILLENVSAISNYAQDNYYVYCCCIEYDEKVRNEFGGATLVIENFPMFLYHITEKLKKKNIELLVFNACQYVPNREQIFNENDQTFFMRFPFLVKDTRYSYQKEFRVLWKNAENRKIQKPLLIECPEALQYCSFKY